MKERLQVRLLLLLGPQLDVRVEVALNLLYLIVQDEIWYELPVTLSDLTGGDRRLCLPSGVMNQAYDTKNRVVKA